MQIQKIHEIVEKRFREFADCNRVIFENMMYGQILQVYKDTMVEGNRIRNLDMFGAPYGVKYFGKLDGAEGDFYVFLDRNMDKIYTYNANISI